MTKISRRYVAWTGVIFLVGSVGTGVRALDLDSEMNGQNKAFAVHLDVACGNPKKANCSVVVNRLAVYTNPRGLTLDPAKSRGSVQSSLAVCEGKANAGVVQYDAADYVVRTKCPSGLKKVGPAIYPYYGFMVVLADNPNDSLSSLVQNRPTGANGLPRAWNISEGQEGSGGKTTFDNILKAHPEYLQSLGLVPGLKADDAFRALKEKSIDGYFFMDGLKSDEVEKFKAELDENNKPRFKFIAVDPGDNEFYNKITAWQDGGKMYYKENIQVPGKWWGTRDIETVAVNAVLILNSQFKDSPDGSQATDIILDAVTQSQGYIRSDLAVPTDWKADQ